MHITVMHLAYAECNPCSSHRNIYRTALRSRQTHGCIGLLTFDTRRAVFYSMGTFAHGAMSMFHVHLRCRDKSSTCLLSARPSSTRSVDVRGIDLQTSALSRAILTAPKTSDKCASLVPRLISTFRSVLASRYYSARPC